MIVPLRPFGGAVQRNYARRRLREFFRHNRDLFPPNQDVLIRLHIAPADWDRFLEEITGLLGRIPRTTDGNDIHGKE
ncbi:MAG: ribonuclease P protein component [bacterium]